MDNNIGFIKTIKVVSDFEELVRRYCQKIYGAEAYLVGGPYDGGRDLCYHIRGREVKCPVQITIQEKNIESKVREDLEKVVKLVDGHNYPPMMIFFWSHVVSASKEDQLKTIASREFGITLELFDANKMGQKITNDYPDLLKYLLEDIHKYKFSHASAEINIKQRTFYDYLVLSKDTASLKHVIVDSHIVSTLSAGSTAESELAGVLHEVGVSVPVMKSRLGHLRKSGRINFEDGLYTLVESELIRINNVAIKDQAGRDQVLGAISKVAERYTDEPISEKILSLIQEAYGASVDIQISEENFEPPKLAIVKSAVEKIANLLRDVSQISEADSKAASQQLIEISAQNEYLANYCSTRLCIGLLNQSKLEKYVEEKKFFLYLDAPVFIYYLSVLQYKDVIDDNAFRTVAHMKDVLKRLKQKEVRVTLEHLEETVRHLENAERISRFASDELIASLGDSKNVFFNLYLRVKKDRPRSFIFRNFLAEFIGYESAPGETPRFRDLLSCARTHAELGGVRILSVDEKEDDFYTQMYTRYMRVIGVKRKRQTFKNDVLACQILGETSNHLDSRGMFQVPFMITWDSTQHGLRKIYREKFPYDEWVVYPPHRAIERLAMLDLKINSEDLKEGVLAIIDEDFFKDARGGNLLDTLAIFLGDHQAESGAVVSLLTRLSRRISDEPDDLRHTDFDARNALNEILIFTEKEFRGEFSTVLSLFADETFSPLIFDLLAETVKEEFGDTQRNTYADKLRNFILEISRIRDKEE